MVGEREREREKRKRSERERECFEGWRAEEKETKIGGTWMQRKVKLEEEVGNCYISYLSPLFLSLQFLSFPFTFLFFKSCSSKTCLLQQRNIVNIGLSKFLVCESLGFTQS